MIESKFIKEFIAISDIYRAMNKILKEKLYKNNIPLNETQIVLLFLMNDHSILTPEEMFKIGHFSTSNLLFNINTLVSNHFAKSTPTNPLDEQLNIPVNLSKDGKNILKNIDKIFKNINIDTHEDFISNLLKYEKKLENLRI